MANQLHLALLGKPQFKQNGNPISGLKSVKAQAILAYLAVTRQTHSRSALAGLLWGDMPEQTALTNLRAALSQLRRSVGDHLTITRRSVALADSPAVWLDVAILEMAANSSLNLQAAADLYRGDFLDDFYVPEALEFEDWALVERERLRQLAVGVLHQLVEQSLRDDSFSDGLRHVRRILALEPWREMAHRQLMQLLAASGQRGAALAQYDACRQLLSEELGVEPSTATTALYEAIKAGAYPDPAPKMAPPRLAGIERPPHNLPAATTSFVGRQAEQTQLNHLLADSGCRLLTLVGPGGIGKTRLALAAAQAQIEAKTTFSDGVYLVPLAPVGQAGSEPEPDRNPIILAMAEALGLTFSGGQSAGSQLLNALRQKSMLLILDNFEHLAGHAGLLVEILEQAPGIKLMVTSRQVLNLYEEWIFELQGLAYPGDDAAAPETSESVQLFAQRARRVYLGFDLTAEQAAVSRICRLLAGLPLGIELAAAWVRTLSCQEIAQEIQRNLDFLAATVRNVPDRQRSLRAAFEHSWRLLSRPEQEIFSRLTVFSSGFTGEAAAAVAGAPLRTLSTLVDKSLLQRTVAGRYELHELLRQHGREMLADASRVQAVHARFYAGFLQEREEAFSKGDAAANADIAAEIENLRAAWEWSVAQTEAGLLGQLLDGLCSFYELRGWFQEGQALLARAARRLDAEAAAESMFRLRGRVQLQLARFYDFLGQYEPARDHAQTSLALFRQIEAGPHLAGALGVLGFALSGLGDNGQANVYLQESLRRFEQAQDSAGQARTLHYLTYIATGLGDRPAGLAYAERSLALYRTLEHRRGMAACLYMLGNFQIGFGDYERARAYYEESQALHRQLGDRVGVARCLMNQGLASFRLARLDEAEQLSAESLKLFTEFGNQRGIGNTLNNLGNIAMKRGDHRQAREYFERSLAVQRRMGDQLSTALTLAYLGSAAAALADLDPARASFRQALELARQTEAIGIALDMLPAVGRFLAGQNQPGLAVQALARAESHPATEHYARSEAQAALDPLARSLPPEAFAPAQARGQTAPLTTVIGDILAAL